MKLRVLTATKKGKLLTIADLLSKRGQSDYPPDSIPPDYPCERERLVVIVASLAAKMPNSFELFCKDLGLGRASHVALLVDGTPEQAAKVTEWIQGARGKVFDEVLYMKGGAPFKFLRSVSEEETKAAEAWFDRVIAWINA